MTFSRTLPTVLAALLALSACADFPEVQQLSGQPGPTPALLPLDALLAQADAPIGDPAADLAARAARLRARAAAIAPQSAP